MYNLPQTPKTRIFAEIAAGARIRRRNAYKNMENDTIKARVEALRLWMKQEGVGGFIVPTTDPHDSEYTPDHWKAREWLTGFTGSAGTALVTPDEALLWTDSRYFLQAEQQLAGTPFVLMREGTPGTPSINRWLQTHAAALHSVGYVAATATCALRDEWLSGLDGVLQTRPCADDPFDRLWTDRPPIPAEPVTVQPLRLTGRTAREKLRELYATSACGETDGHALLLNDLSEIAWTLNLRGNDIAYNPLFVAYLLIGPHSATLFTDPRRLTDEVRAHLAEAGVTTADYDGWRQAVLDLPADTLLHLPQSMNLAVTEACQRGEVDLLVEPSPVPMLRAVKTPEEQEGFRRAMERDGIAMVRFLRWLDEAVPRGGVTELDVDRQLTAQRATQPHFCGLSFATIAGYGPHGAIVHYEADADSAATLRPEGLLLLDSGAHYEDGTTDITRTVALGPVTDEERRVYTLVLKGHIGLSRCRFPEGTTGLELDLASRQAMWHEGYDFGHGTGHGVGSRLCVHEGPHQIRKDCRPCTLVPFRAGMTITDEPGIYVAGRFGVRIENTLLVVPGRETAFGRFLEFEPLTLCPIDLRPVDRSMLTAEETAWLNAYHATVRTRLMPLLADEADRRWLEAATQPL